MSGGSVRTQGSLASASLIRGMVRGRGWLVQTVHPRPRRSGMGAPRSAPGGSAAGPVGGGSTSGPAPRLPISRTRPTACGSPCAGVSAIRSASGTSSSSCSSEATQSRTSRSGTGSAAAPRCSRIGGARSGAATPAVPGTWTRPPCKSPGAGAPAQRPRLPAARPGSAGDRLPHPTPWAVRRGPVLTSRVAQRSGAGHRTTAAIGVTIADLFTPQAGAGRRLAGHVGERRVFHPQSGLRDRHGKG